MDIWQIRHCQCTRRRWPSPQLFPSLAPFLLPAPAALPRCCENRALSYRAVVNDSYDDEPLKRTTTLSAIGSRALMGAPSLTARSGPPSITVGRRRFSGRALKPLHLNAVKGKKEGKKQKNQKKNVRVPPKTSIEKEREKTRHGIYHSSTSYRQAHHYHPTRLQQHQERHRPEHKSNSGVHMELGMIST